MIISLWIIYFAIIYTILFIAYTGWGYLFFPLIRAKGNTTDNYFTYAWTGWASSILIFQLINLLLPVTPLFSCFFFIIGLVLSVRAYSISGVTFSTFFSHRYFFLAVFIFILWTAAHALMPPRLYDSGLYHFNSVRWLCEYAIVPGLGNLHGRLAFNMTSFFHVASLNCFPPFNIGSHLANSFLLVLLFAECIYPVFLWFRKIPGPTGIEILIKSALLPLILAYSIDQTLSAPSPDFCSGILRIVLFYNFILILMKFQQKQLPATLVNYLLFMAVTAVTVKLTNAMYSLTLVSICILLCIIRWKDIRIREHVMVVIFAGVLLTTWMGRGLVLSGYPLYPADVFGIDTEWTVSDRSIDNEIEGIKGYKKSPGNKDISGSNWILPWFRHKWGIEEQRILKGSYLYYYLILSATLTSGYLIAVFLHRRVRTDSPCRMVPLAAIAPLWTSLIFWFVMSPGLRFAWPFPLLLCLASALPYFLCTYRRQSARLLLLILLPLIINLPVFDYLIDYRPKINSGLTKGAKHHRKVKLKKIYTDSSLKLYTPRGGDQCWDSPLPCTPYPNKKLRLRKGSIQSGFVLD